ncbi:hypothetical protein K474DRAFT_533127 [Panus rudis PR-1116 ss-1]|nr:hypothetical protein K474DRAFT_533127 [Panus rudis PR-1116 ss-1]
MSTATGKRKSTGGDGGNAKKAKIDADPAAALVATILANPTVYPIPSTDDDIRKLLLDLAQYARNLEGRVASASVVSAPAVKSQAELEEAAEKIRRAAVAGIKKQMSWKPSCKTGSAKWSYDGICPDPNVFGMLMGEDKAPTWKQKKLTADEFQRIMGDITASVRYDTLYLTGNNVNVRWSNTGEFKFSGTYGLIR